MITNRRSVLTVLLAITALGAFLRGAPAWGQAPAEGERRPPYFQVTIPPAVEREPPFTGRIVIYLKREGANLPPDLGAGDAPFFDDPQPIYSMAVKDMMPGDQIRFVEEEFFPYPLKDLPFGRYQAMAVLDQERSHSSWRKEERNLNSPYRYFEIKPLKPGQDPPFVRFELIESPPPPIPLLKDLKKIEIDSKLLTDFRGEPVKLRAGVVMPVNFDKNKKYPAVYWVHAFPSTAEYTGDWRDAVVEASFRQVGRRPTPSLFHGAFYICLDAQGPYGHHLFADSANNGPVGRALVEELIPAIEAEFPSLIAKPEARALRGQSSGGWSAIWLAMNYPGVFGGAWATSPDPVDFRAFQLVNIYEAENMYTGPDGKDLPAYRVNDQPRMTIRQENGMERAIGPNLTSAQQWCSWQAAFGPRDDRTGLPRPLFDSRTGKIDRAVAKQYEQYDISALVRKDPTKYGPIFRDRVRLICGQKDNFYLSGAVEMLAQELGKAGVNMLGGGKPGGGYIEIRPGADHGVISSSDAVNALWGEIENYFRAQGLMPN